MEKTLIEGSVDQIAALAKEASKLDLQEITAPKDMSGVPDIIPVAFDPRTEGDGLKGVRALFEEWRVHPERRRGTAEVGTLASFIALTKYHKNAHSAIFANTNWPGPLLQSVLNYHEGDDGDPQDLDHRVSYKFPLTEEFTAWIGQNAKPMTQGDFAAFIEERVADLASADPQEAAEYGGLFQTTMATPAEMLALSRGLEVNVAGKVKNNVRLSSGEGEIVFAEEHLGANGEKITVPGLFMVNVPAFLDGEHVRLPARLRYRVANGSVSWFYQLYRWKELLRERVVGDLDTATEETGLPSYEGSPEK